MFPDYDTPGSDLSGAPASVAAAHASESDAHASVEPSSDSDSEPVGQENNATPASDTSSVANGSANTLDFKGPRDLASVSQNSTTEISVPAEEATSPSSEELNQLMDQYAIPQQAPTEGEIVEGRVVAIADVGAVVDIGGKTEALIPAGEFMEAKTLKFSSPESIKKVTLSFPTNAPAGVECGPIWTRLIMISRC